MDEPRPLDGFTAEQLPFFDRELPPEVGLSSFAVRGAVDVDALRAAVRRVVRRHSALRARVVDRDGVLTQVVLPPSEDDVPFAVGAWSAAEGDAEALVRTGPDLACEGPLRVHWAADGDGAGARARGVLVLALSHPWSDAWSIEQVGAEVWRAYDAVVGGGDDLPDEERGLAARVAEQAALRTVIADADLQAWRAELAPVAAAVDLPAHRRDPLSCVRAFDPWPDDEAAAAVALAASTRSTLPIVSLAACAAAFRDVLGIADVTYVTPLFTRKVVEGEPGEVGYCQALAPVRVRVEAGDTIGDLVTRARRGLVKAMMRARAPYAYTRMLRALTGGGDEAAAVLLDQWRRGATTSPTFVPLFNPVVSGRGPEALSRSVEVEPVVLVPGYSPCAVLDLMVVPEVGGGGPSGLRVHHDPAFLGAGVVGDVMTAVRSFLRAGVTEPVGRASGR